MIKLNLLPAYNFHCSFDFYLLSKVMSSPESAALLIKDQYYSDVFIIK